MGFWANKEAREMVEIFCRDSYAALMLFCSSTAGSANIICLLLGPVIIAGKVYMGSSGSWGILDPKSFFNRAVRQPFPYLWI